MISPTAFPFSRTFCDRREKPIAGDAPVCWPRRLFEYIRNQAEHHAQMSFKDAYRQLCEKHEIAIDERYVWD